MRDEWSKEDEPRPVASHDGTVPAYAARVGDGTRLPATIHFPAPRSAL
ncbi:hypothetical protein [Halosegnis marinus]|nr:hypothetical protein [Halosegnis sp. DT85]